MTKGKMKLWLEIAINIINNVLGALYQEKRIEKARELQEILRQLIIFEEGLQKKEIRAIKEADDL